MKNRTKLPNVYLGVLLALMYVPILLVIVYSFNESKTSAVWAGFSWKWYEQLFRDEDLFEALKNSIVLGVLSSCAAAVIGTLGAYGMGKVKFPLKGAVEYVSTLPIMIPEIILGMVFMAFVSLLGLPFGMTTLVIAHTAFSIPYVFMLVKARLVGMDQSLLEAAQDLGANSSQVFRRVIFPLSLPGVLSGVTMVFIPSVSTFVISRLLGGGMNLLLGDLIEMQFLGSAYNPHLGSAISLVMMVIVLVSMGIMNRFGEGEGEAVLL